MKFSFFNLVILSLLVFSFWGCSNSTESIAPSNSNSISMMVDGVTMTSTAVSFSATTSSNFLVGSMPNGYIIGITIPKGVGSFPIGGSTIANYINYSQNNTGSYMSVGTNVVGTLTFTENSDTKVSGTFTCRLVGNGSATGSKNLTNGVFKYSK